MKVNIEDIKIGNRIRQEMGDISSLKQSIQKMGLINPVIINEKNELMSGFRRLEACRQLGWIEVDVRVINTASDKVMELDLEYHENLARIDLTPDDSVTYSKVRNELLNPPKPEIKIWAFLKKIWGMIKSLFKR